MGETLIEVLIALVVIGAVIGAFFSAIATTSGATKSHRDYVSADAMLRDSAEITKRAVRDDCSGGGTTYSVAYSSLPSPGPGFAYPADVTGQPCPPVTGSFDAQVPTVTLTVTVPGSHTKSLDIAVRTP